MRQGLPRVQDVTPHPPRAAWILCSRAHDKWWWMHKSQILWTGSNLTMYISCCIYSHVDMYGCSAWWCWLLTMLRKPGEYLLKQTLPKSHLLFLCSFTRATFVFANVPGRSKWKCFCSRRAFLAPQPGGVLLQSMSKGSKVETTAVCLKEKYYAAIA